MVTYAELIQFVIMLIAFASLILALMIYVDNKNNRP